MVDHEARRQWLRVTFDQLGKGVFVPVGVATFRSFLFNELLFFLCVLCCLLQHLLIYHDVFRGLGPHVPAIVEAPSTRPPSDLLELAHAQESRAGAVIFAKLSE